MFYLCYDIFPSYNHYLLEYLLFLGWESFDRDFLEYNKNRLKHHLASYISDGGFPEILGKNEFEAKAILTHIYNDILSRDIVSRHNTSFETARKISYFLLSNAAKEFSYRKIASNLGISVETAEKYVDYLTESFMLITLNCFSFKIPVQFKQNKKIYCIDSGLKNAISFRISEDKGRLYENAVLVELKRRGKEVYYWKDEEKREIDFLLKESEKITHLIQVCWSIDDKKTKEREIISLVEGMNLFKLKNGMIITENYESEEIVDKKKIVFVPLWKWLLI